MVTRALANTDPALRRCWHPVARTEEVLEQPHGVMLLGEPWVLYRAAGTVRAFADRCPHRHCPLTLGHCEGGVLQCAYHGWRFDESGRCVEIPALGEGATLPPAARLSAAAGVTEAHGIVFLAPETPIAPLGAIPEADDDASGRAAPDTADAGIGGPAGRQLPRYRPLSLRSRRHVRHR